MEHTGVTLPRLNLLMKIIWLLWGYTVHVFRPSSLQLISWLVSARQMREAVYLTKTKFIQALGHS